MSEDRIRHVLARITDNPELARVVPLLQPEVLHAVITRCGLHDCGELLALATPQQLSAVFDLDLWKANHAGGDEQFDAERFCEWLEVLVNESPAIAAARLAAIDPALVVAGLSPSVTVLDPAVFSPLVEPSGADPVSNAGRERGLHAEIGGFIVVARRSDAWEAIVEVLLALDEHHSALFHRVMRACRTLSNSGFELDGLDDLLPESAQTRFDLSISREQRRDRLGFLSPQQARAFLDAARHVRLTAGPPQEDQVFIAYRRSFAGLDDDQSVDLRGEPSPPPPRLRRTRHSFSDGGQLASRIRRVRATEATAATEPSRDSASAVASVIEVLRGAGMLAEAPRALLPGGQDEQATVRKALSRYLQLCAESGEAAWAARNQELAFLANALVAGCSVQGRSITRREAIDAVSATCNLGLESWPPHWPPQPRDLVTIFQVGWGVLHREVSMATAAQLLRALDRIHSGDRDLQLELHALCRELRKQQRTNTPWRARGRLDVLAPMDLPAWAALAALLDECPVMLANVSRRGGPNLHTVDPSEFEFIAHAGHIAAVHEFLLSIPERLT